MTDIILDPDLPAGFDADDLDDQLLDGLPAEYDPAADLIGGDHA